jgi:hypothetical protein
MQSFSKLLISSLESIHLTIKALSLSLQSSGIVVSLDVKSRNPRHDESTSPETLTLAIVKAIIGSNLFIRSLPYLKEEQYLTFQTSEKP